MTPIEKCEPDPKARSPRLFIATAIKAGMTRTEAKAHYDELIHAAEWWGNEKYSVLVFRGGERSERHGFDPRWKVVHVSLHRRDRAPCNDWRELQEIKTAVLGAEAEAVMLYPAESRVVDTSNEYHLWAMFDENDKPVMWPIGMNAGRVVTNNPGVEGAVQRPLVKRFERKMA